ncbi:DUF1579 family protein [Acanthopleuribacter pedis]|uniref:DUF1579 family protein n=1 Tax=Acanthopleuribacter pedis TaxID=442870 RepID=A0A8J7QE67_9BACT|nr:DUF1579 family protein [Acanthopleuribacter pedis]MBO1322219.1 DUF1579 family protein [Acanthopleuribacter pedis]
MAHFIRTSVLFVLSACVSIAWAEDGDAIVQAHLKARGGAAAWAKVNTLQLEGQFTGFSITHPFVLQKQRPNKVHMRWTLGDNPMEMGFDGQSAWWSNPWYGTDWITPMGAVDRGWQRMYHPMATPFFDYKAHGLTMSYKGRGDLDGQEGFVFEFNGEDGYVETWYLDPDTHLEFARVATGSEFGRPTVQNTWFDDFKKVGDLVVPHRIESEFHTRHRVLEVEKVTVNPDLGATSFGRPTPEPLKPLMAMEGTWQVSVKQRSSPRQPWDEHQVTSVIHRALDGQVLQETVAYGKRVPREMFRQYSYDRSRDRLLIMQTDNYANNTAILAGAKTEDQWQWDNTKTDSAWKAGAQTIMDRVTLKELSDTAFKLECASSRDEGETWEVHTELSYQRK